MQQYPFSGRVARAVRLKADKKETMSIGQQIYTMLVEKVTPFRAAVVKMLEACNLVDEIKIVAIGRNAPTGVSNQIQGAIISSLAMRKDWVDADIDAVLEMQDAMVLGSPGSLQRWFSAKLYILHGMMRMIRSVQQYVESFPELSSQTADFLNQNIDAVKSQTLSLMEGIAELRKYGVKSSFSQRGFPVNSSNAWVIWDFAKLLESSDVSNFRRKDQLIQFALATEASQISTLAMNHTRASEVIGMQIPFPCQFSGTMDRKGELSLDLGLGIADVGEIFRSRGRGTYYEAVRMILALNLYDLVVPIVKLAGLPDVPTIQISRNPIARALDALRPKKPIQDVMLPRLRVLENHASVHEDLEREISDAESETARRSLRRHEVVGHVRILPNGHRPSVVARHLAMEELGIELADNETFVQKHERGTGEWIMGHRAKHSPR